MERHDEDTTTNNDNDDVADQAPHSGRFETLWCCRCLGKSAALQLFVGWHALHTRVVQERMDEADGTDWNDRLTSTVLLLRHGDEDLLHMVLAEQLFPLSTTTTTAAAAAAAAAAAGGLGAAEVHYGLGEGVGERGHQKERSHSNHLSW
jgi:hypothetical protein